MNLLQRIIPGPGGGALADTATSRRVEAAALATHGEHVLMQRAGQAVASLALALAPHAQRFWIAAGPGNNGGDGLVAAHLLRRLGKRVDVTWLGDRSKLSSDAAWALALAESDGLPATAEWPAQTPDLAIDALLGLGGTRAPTGVLLEAITRLNALACPCLAVDLPSGLDGDTGRLLGESAVRAGASLSLLTLKPGLFTGLGRDHAGEIWFADLGVAAPPDAAPFNAPPSTSTASPAEQPAPAAPTALPTPARLGDASAARRLFSPRLHADHKGSFGDVWVIGGAPGMEGAVVLASRAAVLAGAGRVLVNRLSDGGGTKPAHDPLHPEIMHRGSAGRQAAGVLEAATVVCGCGGGEAVAAVLPAALSRAARLVLDADALNAIASDGGLAEQFRRRGRSGRPTVLTPHPLEAARLLGCSTAQVQADRLAAAHALATRFGAVVVLKGSGTVLSAPALPTVINPTGNARLATAGSGDVLAGWLGGLWSRHAGAGKSGPAEDAEVLAIAHQAAEAAVWLHGRAAELDPAAVAAGQALPASELLAALPGAVARASG